MLLFGYIGVKQLIPPIRKYVMEIRDMQKQLKSLSILLKSDSRSLEIFCNTRSDYDKSPRNDVGTQYRSEIFYHNEEQKKTAEDYIGLMTAEDTLGSECYEDFAGIKIL
jgi:peptide-methionine (S)-S-oxide reductase